MLRMPDLVREPVRLIGLGNIFRGDDAAGIVLAERIRREKIPGLEVLLHFGDGASLIPLWDKIKRVILVDAVCAGGKSGKLISFDLQKEAFPENLFSVSSHSLGIPEALRIAKKLHRKLPAGFMFFGVTAERFNLGSKPSFNMDSLGDMFISRIKAQLSNWLDPKEENRCTSLRS
jgi:hydrogenase maturation protease